MTDQPQLYLISPPAIELDSFLTVLADVLDSVPVACFRLALTSLDEDQQSRAADRLRDVCHGRDVAIVIDTHLLLAERLGLDGVHLSAAQSGIRDARKALGQDAIVGAFAGTSRHDGLTAGEAGADYVSFGPIGSAALGDGQQADRDLFAWWSEMIELPVVAEGALSVDAIQRLAPVTDFFGIGEEAWSSETPLDTIRAMHQAMTSG